MLPTLWTLTAPIYILGGLLFGVATFRARIFPRGAAVLLALGTLLAPVAGLLSLARRMPKIAIPTGLALAWLGYALMTERRTRAPNQPSDGRSRRPHEHHRSASTKKDLPRGGHRVCAHLRFDTFDRSV